jgi:DNA polymerase III subunit epsilon
MASFVAIDFETADYGQDSACAIGLVRVVGNRIVKRKHYLVRPPRRTFFFTHIHGIEWRHVHRKPTFRQLWPRVRDFISDVDFIAAHYASFDRNVLIACCKAARVKPPHHQFVCTMILARRTWNIYPTKLPDVCSELGIRLNHHHALSDAEASARIVIASRRRKA